MSMFGFSAYTDRPSIAPSTSRIFDLVPSSVVSSVANQVVNGKLSEITDSINSKLTEAQKEEEEKNKRLLEYYNSNKNLHELNIQQINFLDSHGIADFTMLIGLEKWDDQPYCYGREAELRRIETFLNCSRKTNNVIVSGHSGVGKTVLIRELARQISLNERPLLKGCRVLLMKQEHANRKTLTDVATIIGKKAICVFDECHDSLFSNQFDMSSVTTFFKGPNIAVDGCKDFLGSHRIKLIGMTDRLGDFLKKDPARARRFTVLPLEELSIDATIQMIKKSSYIEVIERKHNVRIELDDCTLLQTIYLAIAYHKTPTLPSKVYEILDPAVTWFLGNLERTEKTAKRQVKITTADIINYLVEVDDKGREDVEERLLEMIDLHQSPIPLDSALAKCTINLSSKARRGKLAPVWNRDKILENLGNIYTAIESNNVLLTGPSGSGKTRIAEGLAVAIQNGQFPQLKDKEVLLLKWDVVQSNFSDFLKSAAKYSKRYILVIDEAHRLSGGEESVDLTSFLPSIPALGQFGNLASLLPSGKSKGAGAFEAFKDLLGRGEMSTLIMTTERESLKIRSDAALMRRVVHFKLSPFTKDETIQILEKEMPVYQKNYEKKLDIQSDAFEAVFYLSEFYLKGEFQPAASKKFLDLTCAAAMNSSGVVNEEAIVRRVAKIQNQSVEEVQTLLLEERLADCPSSRRIPSGEALMRFSDNFTKIVRKKHSPDLVGHEEALEKMMLALSRGTCNNVLLIGNAGTGKTTLVKMLAKLMIENRVSRSLQDIPLLALRINDLKNDRSAFSEFITSAQTYRGQYVLFIDEFHLFLGSREFEQLKPLLADGAITLIGATTPENLMGIQIDEATKRRFTTIEINPPTTFQAIKMLQTTQEDLQSRMSKRLRQKVIYKDGSIEKAVEKADREKLPASAISLLEIAAAKKANQGNVTLMQEDVASTSQQVVPHEEIIEVNPQDIVEEEPSYFDTHEEANIAGVGMGDMMNVFKAVAPIVNRRVHSSAKPQAPQKKSGFFSGIGSFFYSLISGLFYPIFWIARLR